MSGVSAIVLAAGMGTRMKSALPKVMHAAAGRPLLHYPVQAAFDAGVERVVVVTSGRPEISAYLHAAFGERVLVAVQEPPRGTGDAARVGLEHVQSERVVILYGDTPLVRADEIQALLAALQNPASGELSFMSAELGDPRGYGRVLRDAAGNVTEIREHRDLRGPTEHAVSEVNAGVYAGQTAAIAKAIAGLRPNNTQGEYYLTDIVAALAGSSRVSGVLGPAHVLLGVNDRVQLVEAEEQIFQRIRAKHGRNGVTVRGLARIDDSVEIGVDALIESAVVLRGQTRVGARTVVDVGSVLTDALIGEGVRVLPYTVITSSTVGNEAQLGPFAHLRPESEIEAEAHIGNFVETKKTRVRRGAKANHLAYLGDGDIGERANIGAGTIFCNYDGFGKHKTVIGEGAFIGSDSQLVAPLSIGKGAYVATGTTVTMDVPDDALAIGRTKQANKEGYAPRLKARLKAAKEAMAAKKP